MKKHIKKVGSRKSNILFFAFIALLLIFAVLTPTSLIKDMQLFTCLVCDTTKTVNTYYCDFLKPIPPYTFTTTDVFNAKDHAGHIWDGPYGDSLTSPKLPGREIRFFILFLTPFIILYRFILKKYLRELDLLKLFSKYRGVTRLFTIFSIFVVISIMLYLLFAVGSQFSNSITQMKNIMSSVESSKSDKNTIGLFKDYGKHHENVSANNNEINSLLKKLDNDDNNIANRSFKSDSSIDDELKRLEGMDNNITESIFKKLEQNPVLAAYIRQLRRALNTFLINKDQHEKDIRYFNSMLDKLDGKQDSSSKR